VNVQLVSMSGATVFEGSWSASAWCLQLFLLARKDGTVCRLCQGDREIGPWDTIASLDPGLPVQVLLSPLSPKLVRPRSEDS